MKSSDSRRNGFSKVLVVIVCSIVAVVAIFVLLSVWGFINISKNGDLLKFTGDHILTKAELIQGAIEHIKKTMTLPQQLDEMTTLVDVTQEPDAMRYHYILDGIDTDNITQEKLKQYLTPRACNDKDVKSILNKDVNLEYSYIIKESQKEYLIVITKSDCI